MRLAFFAFLAVLVQFIHAPWANIAEYDRPFESIRGRFSPSIFCWLKTFVATMVCAVAMVGLVIPNAYAQVPLTTTELRRMLGNPAGLVGIQYNQAVGMNFQRSVLGHLPGPKFAYQNTKPFSSNKRTKSTNNLLQAVIPDGVAGASIGNSTALPMLITAYPESTFIEVKAVKGTINLAYGRHQIAGMIDVLSNSQAASSTGSNRAYPNLFFVTTADTIIAVQVHQEATLHKVLLWQSYVVVLPNNQLQIAQPTCLNCATVLGAQQLAGKSPPGIPFRLNSLGAASSGSLDSPILDDGMIGYPGNPGNTSPNP